MRFPISLILLTLLTTTVIAQTKLPLIKATTKNISIKDGEVLSKNAWTLSPQTKLDIYTADRTRKTKYVTFYTDIDSIRVKVKPGSRFNFIILLNGKDTCHTQIASAIAPGDVSPAKAKPDTIPFTLTPYNAIAIKAIVNQTDTLKLHYDISSQGIHFLRSTLNEKLRKQKISTLQIGATTLRNPEILTAGAAAHDMDGRIGYTLFEGKQVELDYDHNLMIIHTRLPNTKGYTRAKLGFSHSSPCIKGAIKTGKQTHESIFTLDNGSEQALILDSAWTAREHLAGHFIPIRTTTIRDGRGKAFETKIMQAPQFELLGFSLKTVPATILSTRNPAGFELNYLGNDLLKRFNLILDLKNDQIYLKPNKHWPEPYREKIKS